ncbi:GreA/GreB family elongation factor [Marinobacterium sedimentorum]|uniref:GreA/GreB family elongation factor n=1 Tax=Marinobacterium sedimentorum TaxID=2927804 RepID=UPI0020C5FE7C|nr:GreA/GreB family elongation factor [Marinobacterium sedimentorum]MCP8689492.1 GreA/GreB family elongation factor [Marinobacterium sedimentorum]
MLAPGFSLAALNGLDYRSGYLCRTWLALYFLQGMIHFKYSFFGDAEYVFIFREKYHLPDLSRRIKTLRLIYSVYHLGGFDVSCFVPASFKSISERLSYCFLTEEGFSYTSPLNLLVALSRLEQLDHGESGQVSSVRPGAKLLVKLLQTGDKTTLLLVDPADPAEAGISVHRISVLSPLGSALLGRVPGEVFKVRIFWAVLDFELLSILY